MKSFIDRLTERIRRLTGGRMPAQKDLRTLAIVFTVVFAITVLDLNLGRSLVFAALAALLWMIVYRDRLPENMPRPGRLIRRTVWEIRRLVRNGQYRDMMFYTLKRHVKSTLQDLKNVASDRQPERENVYEAQYTPVDTVEQPWDRPFTEQQQTQNRTQKQTEGWQTWTAGK